MGDKTLFPFSIVTEIFFKCLEPAVFPASVKNIFKWLEPAVFPAERLRVTKWYANKSFKTFNLEQSCFESGDHGGAASQDQVFGQMASGNKVGKKFLGLKFFSAYFASTVCR